MAAAGEVAPKDGCVAAGAVGVAMRKRVAVVQPARTALQTANWGRFSTYDLAMAGYASWRPC